LLYETLFIMNRVVLGIVGLIFVIILAGKVLPGIIDTTASESYSQPFTVVTGANTTTATETLAYASYYDDLTGLTASSNNGADTPIVMSYDSTTNDVGIAGLKASDTRILTIGYYREAHTEFYGVSPFMRFLPALLILGGIVASIFGIYSGIKSRG
jgi:hypothetical protein